MVNNMSFDATFVLSLVGILGGGGTAVLAYLLKSRCRTVECCCIKCERDVISLTAQELAPAAVVAAPRPPSRPPPATLESSNG